MSKLGAEAVHQEDVDIHGGTADANDAAVASGASPDHAPRGCGGQGDQQRPTRATSSSAGAGVG
jgi:hypothetical protein